MSKFMRNASIRLFGKQKRHTKASTATFSSPLEEANALPTEHAFFIREQRQKGGQERLLDWHDSVTDHRGIVKEDFLQMKQSEGGTGWHDVRVTLRSSVLIVSEMQGASSYTETDTLPRTNNQQRQITIYKSAGEGLGISIQGGIEHDLPVLISKVREGGPAADAGNLHVGDELLEVDGVSFVGLQHHQAATLLRSLRGKTAVVMTVKRFPRAGARILSREFVDGDTTAKSSSNISKWVEVIKIPVPLCSVSPYEDRSAKLRKQGAFLVRGCNINEEVLLRAPYGETALRNTWIDAIRETRDHFPTPQLSKGDPPEGFSGLVLKMGRVHERLENGEWRDFFMVLTDHDLSFYSHPPGIAADLDVAVSSYPLLTMRYVSGKRAVEPGDPANDARENEEGCFFLRLATGVRHYFSAGSKNTEKEWAQLIKERTHRAVMTIQSITYPGFVNGQEVALSIDVQTGLWLRNDSRADKSLVWHHPFAHLARTNDDMSARALDLDFAHNGGVQRIQINDPAVVVFVLVAFLSAHVSERTKPIL
eukprot:m.85327 g.85327  ORF g.85327 m.85327 type:complete len:536 (+) comp21261_c0_seq1:71-1678(+)